MQQGTGSTEQAIANSSFDPDYGLNQVESMGFDGSTMRVVSVNTNGAQKTQLVNSSNIEIAPNLEATQLQVKSLIETTNSLIETANAYMNMISRISSTIGTSSDIRSTILSGTVSTVTNLSQIGGVTGVQPVNNILNINAVNSNINNVSTV